MKLVREHIEQFKRGENPFKSLNIGKKAIIETWFETWAPNAKYKIDENLKIYVKGFLDLYNINVSKLPDNLYVKGFLDIRRTNITSLPDGLHIGGEGGLNSLPWLSIRETKITSLPDDLYVKGKIYKDF